MKPTILVVEDEPDILMLVGLTLERAGFEALRAVSGSEAIEKLREAEPALVILDLRLPDMDGWMVLEEGRRMGRLRNSPVIILSAHASPSTIATAEERGAARYFTKPFRPSELVEEVRELLRAG